MDNPTTVQPPVLTVPEAATELRLGVNTTYALIREHRLRAIRIGQRLIVPRAAISEFLASAMSHNDEHDVPRT